MTRKRIWTREEIEGIKYYYVEKGYTLDKIRKIYKTKSDKISEILKSEGVQINMAKVNRLLRHDYFETIDTEAKAYYLGLLVADGCVVKSKDTRGDQISIELTDKEILEELQKEIRSGGKLYRNKREDRYNSTYTWSVRSDKMARDLEKYGVIPNKTYLTDELYYDLREDLKRHYIRGIVDGDGSIYWSRDTWNLNVTSKSENFLEELQDVFMELTGKENRKKITNYNGVHKLVYVSGDVSKLCYVLYKDSNFYLPRKKELAKTVVDDIVLPIGKLIDEKQFIK